MTIILKNIIIIIMALNHADSIMTRTVRVTFTTLLVVVVIANPMATILTVWDHAEAETVCVNDDSYWLFTQP